MLVAGGGREPALLDFFVEAPDARAATAARPSCEAVDVSFGDAVQVFHVGPASCGVYGDAGRRLRGGARWGTVPLERARGARGAARARGRAR